MKKTFFSAELKQSPGYLTKNGYELNKSEENTDYNLYYMNLNVHAVMGFEIYDLLDCPFPCLLDDIQ